MLFESEHFPHAFSPCEGSEVGGMGGRTGWGGGAPGGAWVVVHERMKAEPVGWRQGTWVGRLVQGAGATPIKAICIEMRYLDTC